MKILVIDDDPQRALNFIKAGHDVRIVHGFEQIQMILQVLGYSNKAFELENVRDQLRSNPSLLT